MNPLSWLETHRGRYTVVRWLFPRLLAAIYLIAFVSWGVQYDGLVGENGILPAKKPLENVHAFEEREHKTLFWQLPSAFHWHYSDAFAHGCLIACGVLCVLVMAGVAQGPLLALLWFGYLSFATTGDIFMGYQWDALLLEAGFLALFVAPWRLWSFRGRHRTTTRLHLPPALALFRLMFLSGYVKIGGGDLPWEDMTALLYHYETQPLPNGLSWFAHHWPALGSMSRAAGSCMASNLGCRSRFSLAAGAVWQPRWASSASWR
jgi:lipase maturation factor 1